MATNAHTAVAVIVVEEAEAVAEMYRRASCAPGGFAWSDELVHELVL